MKKIGLRELKRNLLYHIKKDVPFVITQGGKPYLTVLPYSDYLESQYDHGLFYKGMPIVKDELETKGEMFSLNEKPLEYFTKPSLWRRIKNLLTKKVI